MDPHSLAGISDQASLSRSDAASEAVRRCLSYARASKPGCSSRLLSGVPRPSLGFRCVLGSRVLARSASCESCDLQVFTTRDPLASPASCLSLTRSPALFHLDSRGRSIFHSNQLDYDHQLNIYQSAKGCLRVWSETIHSGSEGSRGKRKARDAGRQRVREREAEAVIAFPG